MHSFGVVRLNGRADTTASLIRHDLQPNGPPRIIDAVQLQADRDVSLFSPDAERHGVTRYIVDRDFLPALEDGEARPRGRSHSRLVMETYGWPIKFSKSLLEMVGAMRDAIVGPYFYLDGFSPVEPCLHRAPQFIYEGGAASRYQHWKYLDHRTIRSW